MEQLSREAIAQHFLEGSPVHYIAQGAPDSAWAVNAKVVILRLPSSNVIVIRLEELLDGTSDLARLNLYIGREISVTPNLLFPL